METTSSGKIILDTVGLLKLLIADNGVPAVSLRRKRGKLTLFAEWNEANGDAHPVTTNPAPVDFSRRDNCRWNPKQRRGNGKPSMVYSGSMDSKTTGTGASKARRMSPSARARSQRRLSSFIKKKQAISEEESHVPQHVDGITNSTTDGHTNLAEDRSTDPSAEAGLTPPALTTSSPENERKSSHGIHGYHYTS